MFDRLELHKVSFSELESKIKEHQKRCNERWFWMFEISELLRLIWTPEEIIKKFELYLSVFKLMYEEDIPLFEHDLTNEIAWILQVIIVIYSKLNRNRDFECHEYIETINSRISESLASFLEKNVRYLKESWKNNIVAQIEQITWTYFSSSVSLSTLEQLKSRLLSSLSHWIEVKWLTIWIWENKNGNNLHREEWEEIIIDFLDSDSNIPNSQEFMIIIENLIRNSIKSYNSWRKPKDWKPFRIVCLIKNCWNWKIQFAVWDNWWWLDWKKLVINASKLLQDSIDWVVNWISENVTYILREWFTNPQILKKLTVEEIQQLIFVNDISAFWTTWMWLALSKILLVKRWWEIWIEEDWIWDILFTWIYCIPQNWQEESNMKNEKAA